MIPLRRSQRSVGVFSEDETRRALLISAQEAGVTLELPETRKAGMKCFKRRKRGEPVQYVGGDCEAEEKRKEEESTEQAGESQEELPEENVEVVGGAPAGKKRKVNREKSLSDVLGNTTEPQNDNMKLPATRKLQDVLVDSKPVDEKIDSDVYDENEIVTPKPKRIIKKRRSAARSTGRKKKKKKDVIRTHFGIPEENSQEPECKDADEEYLLVEDLDGSPDVERKAAAVRYAYPSCDDPDAVEVNHSDVQCLEENEYINDTVVDLYIKFVQRSLTSPQDQIHIFNSFFYKKLAEAVVDKTSEKLEKLRKWVKGVNIFEKSYLVMPIHDRLHWSLVIVCFSEAEGHILHLDSMKTGHKSSVVYEVVRRYLMAEWKSQGGAPSDAKKVHVKKVKVPQQDNEYDCGLYMLHFIQSFLIHAPSSFSNELPNNMYDWFSSLEATKLREFIRNILIGFLDTKKEENTNIMENPNQAQVQKVSTHGNFEDSENKESSKLD